MSIDNHDDKINTNPILHNISSMSAIKLGISADLFAQHLNVYKDIAGFLDQVEVNYLNKKIKEAKEKLDPIELAHLIKSLSRLMVPGKVIIVEDLKLSIKKYIEELETFSDTNMLKFSVTVMEKCERTKEYMINISNSLNDQAKLRDLLINGMKFDSFDKFEFPEILKKDVEDGFPRTTDEYMYRLAQRKTGINTSLLDCIRDASIDCFLYNSCVGLDTDDTEVLMYHPNIMDDETEEHRELNETTMLRSFLKHKGAPFAYYPLPQKVENEKIKLFMASTNKHIGFLDKGKKNLFTLRCSCKRVHKSAKFGIGDH
jgi:hypothetical protein